MNSEVSGTLPFHVKLHASVHVSGVSRVECVVVALNNVNVVSHRAELENDLFFRFFMSVSTVLL